MLGLLFMQHERLHQKEHELLSIFGLYNTAVRIEAPSHLR